MLPTPTKIACIGDSITAAGYPQKLEALLGSDYKVLNDGAIGATASSTAEDGTMFFFNSPFHDKTALFKFFPDMVFIKLGTNDTKYWTAIQNEFETDYLRIVDTVQSLPSHPQIFLCLPVPIVRDDFGHGFSDDILVNCINPIILAIAKKRELSVVDLRMPFLHHPEYCPDGVHPDDKGSAALAGIIYRVIIDSLR